MENRGVSKRIIIGRVVTFNILPLIPRDVVPEFTAARACSI